MKIIQNYKEGYHTYNTSYYTIFNYSMLSTVQHRSFSVLSFLLLLFLFLVFIDFHLSKYKKNTRNTYI